MFVQLFDPSRYAFNAPALQLQAASCAAFCFGMFMLGRELDRRLRIAFFLFTTSVSVWLFSGSLLFAATDEATAMVWAKTASLGIAFIPAANYHFSAFALRDYGAVRQRVLAAWIVCTSLFALLVSPDLLFSTLYRYSWGWFPKFGLPDFFFFLYFVGMLSAIVLRLRTGLRVLNKNALFVPDREEALRESEMKYRTLFEESFDGLFLTSPGGAILDINKKGIALLGYATKEEVQRLDLAQDVYADSADRNRVLKLVREQGSAEYEVVVKKKDGAKITAYCSLTAVKDHAGETAMYRGIIRDVTEQKRTREALQEAKQRLEYVVSASPAVIYTCRYGGEWQATFVSENLIEVLGYPARENRETPGFWINRIHPDDRQRVLEGLQNISASDYYAHEYRFLHKDGRYLWMLDRFRVVRDDQGRPVECIGSWLDITERKQAEEDLRTNRIFLNNILNSIQDPIVVLDRNRNILLANRTFESVFTAGRRPEFLGKSCHEILFGNSSHCEPCLAEQSSLTRTVSHKVISFANGPDGVKWYDVFAYPLFATDGRVIGNVHHLRDITLQKKTEEKSVKDQEQLRSLTHQLLTSEERERNRIARELHDEMGQMLTGIKLSLQEIRQQAPEELAKKVGDVQQDLGEVMVRIRELSSKLRPSLLDDLGLLPALQWHIERFVKQTGISVEFKHEEIDRPFPPAASLTLFRIVQEALTNAVRHSGAEAVTILMTARDGSVQVTIADKGAGFDPENALSRRATLGLAGMHERAEMAGGSLTITSAPGKGTEITCSIPVRGPETRTDRQNISCEG